ncbi:MAG: hypothetical protein CVV64_08135 [Candidatus Wallbacteria bacterium HGW-Wallbacteria-1]|jgi:hypothetical protein|uniref:Uncharacterized protein n=1 Tax=Candidatus Wallbacteria bacterium HGW-Wallbacteria-1 TaxID=2013854 RepID=A0A2N1PR77_9BACT|nr:MAG: hypothetical protein CVV64_08135 [Candidatus Wallbacteria bacterium HGW-Wallbacteria-1]
MTVNNINSPWTECTIVDSTVSSELESESISIAIEKVEVLVSDPDIWEHQNIFIKGRTIRIILGNFMDFSEINRVSGPEIKKNSSGGLIQATGKIIGFFEGSPILDIGFPVVLYGHCNLMPTNNSICKIQGGLRIIDAAPI